MDREKFLVVGLGNPGQEYERTRHNAGFCVVRSFAAKCSLTFKREPQLLGDVAVGRYEEKQLLLLLPTTFMNRSGEAVRRCMDYYEVPTTHLIVVCDDVALPVGRMRIRSKGSSGGHNGLKDIEEKIGTHHYARLKLGVGLDPRIPLEDYVLGRFSQEEWVEFEQVETKAVAVLALWLTAGIAAAMQSANGKNEEKGESNA